MLENNIQLETVYLEGTSSTTLPTIGTRNIANTWLRFDSHCYVDFLEYMNCVGIPRDIQGGQSYAAGFFFMTGDHFGRNVRSGSFSLVCQTSFSDKERDAILRKLNEIPPSVKIEALDKLIGCCQ